MSLYNLNYEIKYSNNNYTVALAYVKYRDFIYTDFFAFLLNYFFVVNVKFIPRFFFFLQFQLLHKMKIKQSKQLQNRSETSRNRRWQVEVD